MLPSAVASNPALRRPLKALQRSAVAPGCSPLPAGLAGHKSGRPAAAARQGDRGEGRLHGPVTSRQNNSRAARGGRKRTQLITCISPCARSDGSAAAADRARLQKHVHLQSDRQSGALSGARSGRQCTGLQRMEISTFIGP